MIRDEVGGRQESDPYVGGGYARRRSSPAEYVLAAAPAWCDCVSARMRRGAAGPSVTLCETDGGGATALCWRCSGRRRTDC